MLNIKELFKSGLLTVFFALVPGLVFAQDALQSKIDTGDTAWVLISSALVLFMTAPGLALFYGGMVRRKNVLSTLMQSMSLLCVISVLWVIFGYSLSFGPDKGGIIGSLDWTGLNLVGPSPNPDYAATVPHQAFMLFQMMFAAITPALITGAFAERMKFSAFLVFSAVWVILVYCPVAHWVWGVGGWLRDFGAIDFAGGTVVHISAGASALAAALVIGRRRGYMVEKMAPHNLPMTVIGTGMLWFGWFGFNAGSALGANELAVSAFLATNTAAAGAGVAWTIAEWAHRGKPTILGLVSGIVAGLVAITPASGFVGPMSALLIGLGAGIICYISVSVVKPALGYDDSLDAFGVHGVGGIFGAIATGLFAAKIVNPSGADGLFFGGGITLLSKQFVAILASAAFSFAISWAILKAIDKTIGLRVAKEDEIEGLDHSEHHESGYAL